jgi:hypothetical protein
MWKKWPDDYLSYYASIAVAELKGNVKILNQGTQADLGTRDLLTSNLECHPLQCSIKQD